MKKKVILGLTMLLSIPMLSACNEDINISEATNVIECLKALTTTNNFTLKIDDEVRGDAGNIYYTNNLYYSRLSNYGYAENNEGIYEVSEESYGFITGEVLKNEDKSVMKGLYNHELVTTFKDFNLDVGFEEADTNLYTIDDKNTKLTFLRLIEETDDLLLSVTNFTVEFDGSDENNKQLIFNMELGDDNIECIVKDVGSTSVTDVSNFVNSSEGQPFKVSPEIDRCRELFKLDNYGRKILPQDGTSTAMGIETFTKDYWYFGLDYNVVDAATAAANNKGYMAFDNEVITDTTGDHRLNGLYMYFIFKNTETSPATEYVSPYFAHNISDTTDITSPKGQNYIKNLMMWDNLQYFTENEDFGCYYSDNIYLAADMFLNMGIAGDLEGTNFSVVGSGFTYDLKEKDSECEVNMKLYLTVNGSLIYYEFPFINFGTSNLKVVDDFLVTLRSLSKN